MIIEDEYSDGKEISINMVLLIVGIFVFVFFMILYLRYNST